MGSSKFVKPYGLLSIDGISSNGYAGEIHREAVCGAFLQVFLKEDIALVNALFHLGYLVCGRAGDYDIHLCGRPSYCAKKSLLISWQL